MLKHKHLRQQKYNVLIGLFAGLWFAGFLLWSIITLPFKNPWGITGLLTEMRFNPSNNLARLIVVLLLPLLGLAVAYVICAWRKLPVFEPADRPAMQPLLGRSRIAIAVCMLVLVLGCQMNFSTYHANGGLDTFHEGESLGPGVGYENGQAPYRDMIFVHGIIQDPVRSVVAWRLFGHSISSVRLLESLTSTLAFALLAVAMLYLFGWQPLPAILMMVWILLNIIKPSDYEAVMRMPLTVPARDVMTYAFLLVVAIIGRRVALGKTKNNSVLFFLFTFLPLFTYAYSIDRAFYLSAAWAIAMPLFYIGWVKQTDCKKTFWISSALGAITAFVTFGTLCRWAIPEFVDFVFLKMPKYKELMDGMIFDPFQPVIIFILAQLAFHLYWLFTRYLQCLKRANQHPIVALRVFMPRYFTEMVLVLFATFFFRSAMGRADWTHTSYSYVPTVVLSGLIIWKHYLMPWIQKGDMPPTQRRIWLAVGLSVTLLFGASRAYAAIDSGAAAARYPNGVLDSELVQSPYMQVVDYLQSRLTDGQTFMTMTNEGTFYYLADQPCPIRFPVVWFAMPPFYQQDIVDDLEAGNVQYVIMRSGHWSNAIDGFDHARRLPHVWSMLERDYKYDTKIAGHEIWVKR